VLGVVIAGGGNLCASRAGAQAPTRSAPVVLAERHAAEAFAAYERGDYGRAIVLYEQALAASPSADIAYNLARVHDIGLHDAARAIEWYERYIADPGAAAPRVEAARARVAELRPRGDRLEPSAAPPGGAAPPLAVGAPAAARLAIMHDFPLDAPGLAPAPRAAAGARDAGLGPLETAALTLGSMGLVGVGVGIGFGLAAQARSDEWRRDCDGNACSSRQAVDAAESATRSATIATVGLAAGGGLLALGAALWLIDSGRERRETSSAPHVQPFVRGAGGGTLVSGSF
jgi:tetratricopeptide (TPR) repeat protein